MLVLGDASGRFNISLGRSTISWGALILVFGCTTITPGVANPSDKGQSDQSCTSVDGIS